MSVIAESFGRSAYLLPGDCSPEAKLVKAALVEQGLETPMIENGLTRDEKYSRIRESMKDIVTTLGLDLQDDSLTETPHRIAKMYVDELFGGLDYSNFPKISVIDNGPGIKEEIKDSIFFPMITGKEKGTGLGLSITQGIISQHKGNIHFSSEPNRTEFFINIPITTDKDLDLKIVNG